MPLTVPAHFPRGSHSENTLDERTDAGMLWYDDFIQKNISDGEKRSKVPFLSISWLFQPASFRATGLWLATFYFQPQIQTLLLILVWQNLMLARGRCIFNIWKRISCSLLFTVVCISLSSILDEVLIVYQFMKVYRNSFTSTISKERVKKIFFRSIADVHYWWYYVWSETVLIAVSMERKLRWLAFQIPVVVQTEFCLLAMMTKCLLLLLHCKPFSSCG